QATRRVSSFQKGSVEVAMMKRLFLTLLCGALIGVPVAAQEGAAAPSAPAPTASSIAKLNLRTISFDAARTMAADQTAPPQPQPRPVRASGTGTGIRVAYIASLAAAAAGTI